LEKSGGGDKQPVGFAVLFDHDEEAITSNFVSRLRPRPGVDGRYLTYILAAAYTARLNVRSIKQTTGIQNLDSASYLREHWCIAPSAEQRAIGDHVVAETERLISTQKAIDRQLDLLSEYRQALITAAVTGRIDVRGRVSDPEEVVA
jgi:type I restriction enzyme S subunit